MRGRRIGPPVGQFHLEEWAEFPAAPGSALAAGRPCLVIKSGGTWPMGKCSSLEGEQETPLAKEDGTERSP